MVVVLAVSFRGSSPWLLCFSSDPVIATVCTSSLSVSRV